MDFGVKERNQPKIDAKQIKFQETVEKGEKDKISVLPDCLLLEILSHLPYTKYAITTGILSKRWKHLWTLLPTLIFYHDNHEWSDFVSMVDKTLTQCRQLKLKKFEVYTEYYYGLESHVNSWIRYAIRCNVEELHLSLWHLYSKCEFVVDQYFFNCSCFTDLTLDCCILNPTVRISWKNLKSLCIINEKLDEDLIENILSGSPLLETLALNDCYGYMRLDITSKSVKNLVFSGYFDPEDYSDEDEDYNDVGHFTNIVEINAPNILSLTIQGALWLWKVLLVKLSSVVEAKLDYYKLGHCETTAEEAEEVMLKRFILNLGHVNELKIGGFCYEVLSHLKAKGFIFPSNVKFPGIATVDWSKLKEDIEK